MIVGNYFKGDTNERLKQVQHDAYSELIHYLFTCPKERYLKAAKLIGIETALAEKVKLANGLLFFTTRFGNWRKHAMTLSFVHWKPFVIRIQALDTWQKKNSLA